MHCTTMSNTICMLLIIYNLNHIYLLLFNIINNLNISNNDVATEATYVKAAALSIPLLCFNSLSSTISNSFNSFNPLLDALNSTGNVINWNNKITNSKIIPIFKNPVALENNPINIAIYPSLLEIFTKGIIVFLSLKNI